MDPIEKVYELGIPGQPTMANIAVARVGNSQASRQDLRHKANQLLRTLEHSPEVDHGSLSFRHRSGDAPEVLRNGEHCELKASVSHSGDWVAVGLSTHGNIGIDIQTGGKWDRLGDIADFLELGDGAELDQQQFYSFWVLREAIAKANSDSMLTTPAVEPQLVEACRQFGEPVVSDTYAAMVDVVSKDVHLAVVVNTDPVSYRCG